MPFQTTIGRLTSVEFLAAFPPGFFAFVVLYVCFGDSLGGGSEATLWGHLGALSHYIKENPPVLLFAVFAAYLLGSIIRSMPVKWAEAITPPLKDRFPFPRILTSTLEEIKSECSATIPQPGQIPEIHGSLSSSIFNYWKDYLCARAPESFIYHQSFEARSRFYTGMFWAGAGGVLGGAISMLYCFARGYAVGPGLHLLIISIFLTVAFGSQLGRVRQQEARVLLTLYTIVAAHDEL